MRIIRESSLRKMLKEAYEKGLNIRKDINDQTKKMDECCRGTIISGYDMDKDLVELLSTEELRSENENETAEKE